MPIKLLSSPVEISRTLLELQPRRIAVAYLGDAWRRYIEPRRLQAIIVSPTLGTNPVAVRSLLSEIKAAHPKESPWSRVHFLTNLHAKMFIGKDFILIGSANLSEAALEGAKIEICASLTANQLVNSSTKAGRWALGKFDELLELAKIEFSCDKEKEDQLQLLESKSGLLAQMQKANRSLLLPSERATLPFSEFDPRSAGNITVGWWTERDSDFAVVSRKVNERHAGPLLDQDETILHDYMYFRNNRLAPRHSWILAWRCGGEGRLKVRRLAWIFVHDHMRHVHSEDGRQNMVYQVKGWPVRAAPFNIKDQRFKRAFEEVINEVGSDHVLRRLLPGPKGEDRMDLRCAGEASVRLFKRIRAVYDALPAPTAGRRNRKEGAGGRTQAADL